MKKVSIIVPAYNSRDTLPRCLNSLVNQTLEDIEIIVVNDASTDGTWNVMLEYEKQYPDKLIVVDGGVNRGSGGARNQGFDIASGEYIGLVDSDDYIASNMYELLYRKAKEEDADIVDSGFYSEATDKAMLYTSDDLTGVLDREKRSRLIVSGGYLVTKIFRNELWNDPPLRMREKVRCLEDTEILIYMILRARKMSNVKEVLYNYCDTSASATKTMDLKTYYDSIYGALEAIYDTCHQLDDYEECREALEYAITHMYSYGINRCLYDQIRKYGPAPGNVRKYFNNASYSEKAMLSALAQLKNRLVTGNCRENRDVMQRMQELDILILEECDRRFAK